MRVYLLGILTAFGLLTYSCTSESEPKVEQGTVSIALKGDNFFSQNGGRASRALSESTYSNVNNYTVDIVDANNSVVSTFLYGSAPSTIKLANGNYTIKAYYGEESTASREKFLVTGSTTFAVNADDKSVEVNCAPTCGKMVVDFSKDDMDKYFSDYYVEYKTKALTAAGTTAMWKKTDTDPWYMKLDPAGETVEAIVHYTMKETGNNDSQTLTYDMAPNKSWTMHIAPKDGSGGLSITITIDESTNDREFEIVVPSDWI
jgi:hypothetical protein